MTLRISAESVKDKWLIVAGLLQQHVEELASHKHLMKLDPCMEAYEAMEDAGCLLSLFAYDDDKLIGYSVNFIVPHMHYRELTVCQNDVLFIDPEYRAGSAGIKLIHATELSAKEMGAKLITWHAKPDTKLEGLLPRVGYAVQETVLAKEI